MPRIRRPLLALIVLVLALAIGYGVNAARTGDGGQGPSPTATTTARGATPLSSLPEQAKQTITLIERGGPFPYPHNDGVVFHNNEHLLPREPDGYYREYTVPTPGSPDRGARRIIIGTKGEYYYTGDHYQPFVKIDMTR